MACMALITPRHAVERRQKAANQMKPANIAALRDPETRRAFAEAVGTAMGDWVSAHPAASLEERAGAFESFRRQRHWRCAGSGNGGRRAGSRPIGMC